MSTDTEVVAQLADYCAWLETELGAPMHRSRVTLPRLSDSDNAAPRTPIVALLPDAPRPRPRRLVPILTIAAAAVTVVGTTYVLRHDPKHPSVTPPIDTGAEATVPADAPVGSTAQTFYAPIGLPDGLVVWDVGSIVIDQPQITEQLFGTYTADNRVGGGLLIKIQPANNDNVIQRSIPTITVRGVSADNFRGSDESATDTSLEWEEEGRVVTATGGMKLDDAITLLNGLRWRPDGLDGFDPASSVIPLITEQSSINAPAGHALVLYITSQNGPITIGSTTSPTDAVNVPGEAAVIVGDTSPVIGALMPELVATGTRQPDGSVATVGGSMLVEPDDTVIRFNGDQALRPTVLNSLEPTTVAKLGEVASLSNTRQLQLPVVAATTPGPTQLLLRGGTTDDPVSLCLRTDNDEQCRSSRAQRQMTKWTEVVRIGTRWFILGRQPATDPPPVAYRWQPNGADATLADVIQPDLTDVVGTDTLWYAELPPDLDAVGSGHITNQGVLVDLIGRPSGGIISTGWSRPPW